jgi:GAF domain
MVHSTVPGQSRPSINLFALSIIMAIGYWLFESCMHAFFWHTGPLSETILAQSERDELEMRLVIVALLIGFGWFGQRMMRQHAEADKTIARLNRLLRLSSFLNQNLTRETDRQPLFDTACHAAVEVGGFNLAWIGLYFAEQNSLRAVSIASSNEACLKDVETAGLRKDGAHCRMALEAATGQKPTTCSTFKADDCKAAWRKPLMQHGCQSAAAFPLKIGDSTIGSFVVYAGVEGFFNERERDILAEAASDVSHILNNIEVEKERERSALELRKRVDELERFRKATIDRELRFKSLQNELSQLKGVKEPPDSQQA